MEKETFDKIQEIYSSIISLHPVIQLGITKEERLYLALHDLNVLMEKNGCKKFKLSNND